MYAYSFSDLTFTKMCTQKLTNDSGLEVEPFNNGADYNRGSSSKERKKRKNKKKRKQRKKNKKRRERSSRSSERSQKSCKKYKKKFQKLCLEKLKEGNKI